MAVFRSALLSGVDAGLPNVLLPDTAIKHAPSSEASLESLVELADCTLVVTDSQELTAEDGNCSEGPCSDTDSIEDPDRRKES